MKNFRYTSADWCQCSSLLIAHQGKGIRHREGYGPYSPSFEPHVHASQFCSGAVMSDSRNKRKNHSRCAIGISLSINLCQNRSSVKRARKKLKEETVPVCCLDQPPVCKRFLLEENDHFAFMLDKYGKESEIMFSGHQHSHVTMIRCWWCKQVRILQLQGDVLRTQDDRT